MIQRLEWTRSVSTSGPNPADAIDPTTVAADAWVRIVPTQFSEFDVLERELPEDDDPRGPPPPCRLKVDRKVLAPRDFFQDGANLLVSERVLRALSRLSAGRWSARPAPHPSPNPVRGHVTYELELTAGVGAPSPSSFKGRRKKKPPYGVAGAPSAPVTLDGSSWTGDPLCLTDWVHVDSGFPWRAIVGRGDFIKALLEESESVEGLVLQPVSVEGLGPGRHSSDERSEWEKAAAPWSRPTRWKGSVIDRIRDTADKYEHMLPMPPPEPALRNLVSELERRSGGHVTPELLQLLSKWNGASLFAGMLTFFSIGERTANNAVPERSHSVAADDIITANGRVGDDDWRLTRAPGTLLFAARYASMHAIWGLTAEGRVRLLPQTGEVLGPNIPFEAWLEDQVADLEWAWDNPAALGLDRERWLVDEE